MPQKIPDSFSIIIFGIPILSLALLAVLTFGVSTISIILPQQNLLMGSIFVAVCIFGIVAAIYPSRCSGAMRFYKGKEVSPQVKGADTARSGEGFAGHHPACCGFSSHVFRLGNKVFCAGCTGLIAGAVASIAGGIPYILLGFNIGGGAAPIFWVGVIGVACGLLPHSLLDLGRAFMRLLLNFVFVFGAFLIFVGIINITSNAAIVLFLLALIVYWIYARIALSRQEHRRICANCKLPECPY
jgi:hypothetical protein